MLLKRKSIFNGILIVALVGLVGVAVFILNMSFRISDADVKDDFSAISVQYSNGIRALQMRHPDASAPTIIFIHGAPGSSSQFLPYLADHRLNEVASLVALDRPGYGYSDFGNPDPDIVSQSEQIGQCLDAVVSDSSDWILVTHSYGGAIGVCLGQAFSENTIHHLMLCPVLDPVSEEVFWYSSLPDRAPIKWISGGAMRAAAVEKMTHKEELKKIVHLLRENRVQTHHVHGGKDWLAPIANVSFVKEQFPQEYLRTTLLEEESHFIPFNNSEMVVSWLMELLENP